jgi:AraC-like DNA-binding protein
VQASLLSSGADLDVLSDVLRTVRLTGAVYFDVRARAPWVTETPATLLFRDKVMPEFEHVIAFHIVMEGRCWVYLTDEPDSAVRLETGDAVIIVGGENHVMGSERSKPDDPDLSKYYRPNDRPLPFVLSELGGRGDPINLICGYFGCDARPFNPILGALPRLLHVRIASAGGTLIQELMRTALREMEHPSGGGETILSKLSELLFLQAVRHYLDSLPEASTGWLSGLRDRQIGAALRLLHARFADRWALEELARQVGMSRSAFADRFATLIGVPPMQYLANWRLQVAAQHLERHGMSIAEIAALVGYESEEAFNRAFKKQVGVPPGTWRRSRANAVSSRGQG